MTLEEVDLYLNWSMHGILGGLQSIVEISYTIESECSMNQCRATISAVRGPGLVHSRWKLEQISVSSFEVVPLSNWLLKISSLISEGNKRLSPGGCIGSLLCPMLMEPVGEYF